MADRQPPPPNIELGVFLPHPPSTVWRALTEPLLIEQWLARTTGFDLTVGSTFILEIDAQPPAEVACQVISVKEHEFFSHSYTDLRGAPPARWTVHWQLRPQGHGTRVLLTHSGFDIGSRQQRMARNAIERGWRNSVLPKLAMTVSIVAS